MIRTCRKLLFPNILDAATELGVAERTLRDYEAKGTAPPDIIDKMATIYRKPILRYLFCGNCVIGREIHPEVSELHLEAALLRLNNSVVGIEDDCKDMALILDDGIIDENETTRAGEIRHKLRTVKERIAEFEVNIETKFPDTKKQTVAATAIRSVRS